MKPMGIRLLTVMALTLLSLASPLTVTQKSLALQCNSEAVNFLIDNQIKKKNDLKLQLEQIQQWGGFLYPEFKQEDVMCALIGVLNDTSLKPELRSQAADVLGGVGTAAETAKPYLLVAFENQNPKVRRSAIEAVRKINAHGTVDHLIKALDDQDSDVKRAAAGALVSIAKDVAKDQEYRSVVINKLINLLTKDSNVFVRQDVAQALVEIAGLDTKVVPVLKTTLKSDSVWFVKNKIITALLNDLKEKNIDQSSLNKLLDVDILVSLLEDQNYTLQSSASELLADLEIPDKKLFLPLIEILKTIKTDEGNTELRRTVAQTIGNLAKTSTELDDETVVKTVAQTLTNTIQTDPDDFVRANAAEALGKISPYNSDSQKELTELLNNKNEALRVSAAIGLTNLATPLQDKYQKSPETTDELSQAIQDFDHSLQVMERVSQAQWEDKDKYHKFQHQQDIITRKRDFLHNLNVQAFWQRIFRFLNLDLVKWPLISFGLYVVIYWIILFWIFPLWLLKFDEKRFQPIGEVNPTAKLAATLLTSLSFAKYHPRVLNRWVEEHMKEVRDDFLHKPTVQHHKIYIPLPLQLDSGDNLRTIEQLSSQDLQESFPGHLLIWGESGIGKTSIACQIAKWSMSDNPDERLCKHRMLPVIISENIEIENSGEEKPFIAAIRGQLEAAIKGESISPELLKHLLKKQKILVIVDHFSELNEATRKLIRPGQPDFPVHALVVTSRQEESLGSVLTIKPSQLKGSQISVFLETYLTKKNVRQLFTDQELHTDCAYLSEIVGQRDITPMFAKLYAEQLIEKKVKVAQEFTLPNNIPELIIKYLDELNHEVKGEVHLNDRIVDKDAKSLAWACLKNTYHPSEIMRLEAIAALGGDNAEQRLNYLEEQLHLIQTNQTSKDKIHFILEPLTEYLAAWHLVDLYGPNEDHWRKFLEQLDNVPKAFVIAVRDCCEARKQEAKLPQFVIEQLNQVNGNGVMSQT